MNRMEKWTTWSSDCSFQIGCAMRARRQLLLPGARLIFAHCAPGQQRAGARNQAASNVTWKAGEPPSFSKDWKIAWCRTDNHVPIVAVTDECSVSEELASGSWMHKKRGESSRGRIIRRSSNSENVDASKEEDSIHAQSVFAERSQRSNYRANLQVKSTHVPEDPNCAVWQMTTIVRAQCRRQPDA